MKHSVRKNSKKLTQRYEFLLTLVKLRQGILNKDLADTFCVSPALCSRTFTTWIRLLRQLSGPALVVWLPREAIWENLANVFRKAGYSNCRIILDCAEVFTEWSKSLDNQAYTWLDYKYYNTIKFLVGISPNGFIKLLSDCYSGRTSDKYITKDSGFYDLLEQGSQELEDRGFQIKEKLLFHVCSLEKSDDFCRGEKTKMWLILHAINRIKKF